MLFSILIPTLFERAKLYGRLRAQLDAQISAAGLQDRVEILDLCDNRELSLGAKRNRLVERARGEFIAFIDDDDSVSANYVNLICEALVKHPHVDCLGITGRVYFRGAHPHPFVYSLRYDHYFSQGGVYYRPPYLLNPMRRALAQQFRYANVSYNEDQDWAMRVARAHLLQTEFFLEPVIYHYYAHRHYAVQWAIDLTEPIRHPLGLQFANRLRLHRWILSKMGRNGHG